MLAILLEIIAELLLYTSADVAIEVIARRKDVARSEKAPWVILYLFVGVLLGFISFLIIKGPIIQNENLRIINVFLSPIAIGVLMEKWGSYCDKNGKPRTSLAHFLNAAAVAFAVAITRFFLN